MKKLVLLSMICIATANSYATPLAVRVFGGFARNYHKPDSVITGAAIKAGTGLELGAGLQLSRLFLDIVYFGSGHVMQIQSEKAALTFRSFTIRAGYDLTTHTKLVPYLTGNYSRTQLLDTEGDGFKNGNALGLGTGLRYVKGSRFFVDMSLAYNFNQYGAFAVAKTPWVDKQHLKLNQLMIGVRVGGSFNIFSAAKGDTQ